MREEIVRLSSIILNMTPERRAETMARMIEKSTWKGPGMQRLAEILCGHLRATHEPPKEIRVIPVEWALIQQEMCDHAAHFVTGFVPPKAGEYKFHDIPVVVGDVSA